MLDPYPFHHRHGRLPYKDAAYGNQAARVPPRTVCIIVWGIGAISVIAALVFGLGYGLTRTKQSTIRPNATTTTATIATTAATEISTSVATTAASSKPISTTVKMTTTASTATTAGPSTTTAGPSTTTAGPTTTTVGPTTTTAGITTTTAVAMVNIGQPCTVVAQCPDKGIAGSGGLCAAGACACDTGFVPSADMTSCLAIVNVGGACVVAAQCPSHYDGAGTTVVPGNTGNCTGSVCDCQSGYVASTDNTKCLTMATNIGADSCVQSSQCSTIVHYNSGGTTIIAGPAGVCTNFVCACATNFVVDSTNNQKCLAVPYAYDAAKNKCVRQAEFNITAPCTISRASSGCPLHYDNDKTTYVGYYVENVCDSSSTCTCQSGYTYDSATTKCVRQATIVDTSPCTITRAQSGCPLHYDSDKTTYVGVRVDNSCDTSSKCVCAPGYTYDSSATKRCVRKSAIIDTNLCTDSRVLSGCPLHYGSDKSSYIGDNVDYICVDTTCACQPAYTYDSVTNKCVRQTTVITTSTCTSSRALSGCPLHYDSDKTTYVGYYADSQCDVSTTCVCQTGYTDDFAGTKKCFRQTAIIDTSLCETNRMQSACPLHYDYDATTYVGHNADFSCGASSTCACETGNDV